MNNAVFENTVENVRRHRNIKLVTTEMKIIYLVSELNYHTRKFFTENVLATEMRKTQILMNTPVDTYEQARLFRFINIRSR